MDMATEINMKPDSLNVVGRGQAGQPVPHEYAGLRRQVRKRLMEYDAKIAAIEAKKARLIDMSTGKATEQD